MKKKLLLLCMGLGFLVPLIASAGSGEVTSTNIVGYVKYKGHVGGGYTFVAPPFISVTNDVQTFKLSDIITGNFVNGDTLQFYDETLKTELTAYYRTTGAYPGWHRGAPWNAGTYLGTNQVQLGTGFFVSTSATNFNVLGQVLDTELCLEANKGYTAIGNSTGMDLFLEEIDFNGCVNGDTLQFYDKNLKTELTAYYRTTGAYPGWHTGAPWNAGTYLGNKYQIPAGVGFFLSCANPGVIVTLPGIK